MKASLSAHGVLIITPENPTEEFALSKWVDMAVLLGQGLGCVALEDSVVRGSCITINTRTTDVLSELE